MTVCVVNVGHGGGSLVLGRDHFLMYDAGKAQAMERAIEARGLSNQDWWLMISHLDTDHFAGVFPLLDGPYGDRCLRLFLNPDVREWTADSTDRISLPEGFEPTAAFRGTQGLSKAAFILHYLSFLDREKGGQWIEFALLGKRLALDPYVVTILWPSSAMLLSPSTSHRETGRVPNRNLTSIAIRIDGGQLGAGCVVGGDCGIEAVLASEGYGMSWRCDFLVYPHHGGSIGGVDEAEELLAAATDPTHVVFQTGRRFPALPDDSALQAFRAIGASVACTGLSSNCCSDPAAFGYLCAGTVYFEDSQVGLVTERYDHATHVRLLRGARCS